MRSGSEEIYRPVTEKKEDRQKYLEDLIEQEEKRTQIVKKRIESLEKRKESFASETK